jgi:hypothetical protein
LDFPASPLEWSTVLKDMRSTCGDTDSLRQSTNSNFPSPVQATGVRKSDCKQSQTASWQSGSRVTRKPAGKRISENQGETSQVLVNCGPFAAIWCSEKAGPDSMTLLCLVFLHPCISRPLNSLSYSTAMTNSSFSPSPWHRAETQSVDAE